MTRRLRLLWPALKGCFAMPKHEWVLVGLDVANPSILTTCSYDGQGRHFTVHRI